MQTVQLDLDFQNTHDASIDHNPHNDAEILCCCRYYGPRLIIYGNQCSHDHGHADAIQQ